MIPSSPYYQGSPAGGPVIPDLSPLEPPGASSPTPRSETQNSDEWIMGPWPSASNPPSLEHTRRPSHSHHDSHQHQHQQPQQRPSNMHSNSYGYGQGGGGGYGYAAAPYPVAPYQTPMMQPMGMMSPGGGYPGPFPGAGGGYHGMQTPYLSPATPYMGHGHGGHGGGMHSPQIPPSSPYNYHPAPPGSPYMGAGMTSHPMASMGGMGGMGGMGMGAMGGAMGGGMPGGFPGMMAPGMAPGMMPGMVPGPMARPPSPLNRPKVEEWALNPWLAGADYGPVLDPRTLSILKAPGLRLHPLLIPTDNSATPSAKPNPSLVFNILFPPNAIYLSTESAQKSWSAGRDEPATLPRVTSLRIICRHTPWIIEVKNINTGVTCGDVCEKIHTTYWAGIHKSEWSATPKAAQAEVTMTWKHNRSTAPGAPGGVMGEPLKRVDFLGDRTMFSGLMRDAGYVQERLGGAGKEEMATFVLDLDSR